MASNSSTARTRSGGTSPEFFHYVRPKTGRHFNDGCSVETAFMTLSRAIPSASAGDTILLVPGAYDQDLPQLMSAARVAHIAVGVASAH